VRYAEANKHHSFGCFAAGWTLARYSLSKLCGIDVNVTLNKFLTSRVTCMCDITVYQLYNFRCLYIYISVTVYDDSVDTHISVFPYVAFVKNSLFWNVAVCVIR
jgi:hypothetical protein